MVLLTFSFKFTRRNYESKRMGDRLSHDILFLYKIQERFLLGLKKGDSNFASEAPPSAPIVVGK
jgi:hypothetical protein